MNSWLSIVLILSSFYLSRCSISHLESFVAYPRILSRHKRDTTEALLYVEIQDWKLELKENRNLKVSSQDDCKFYGGRIDNSEGSKAILSYCNGMFYGLIYTSYEDYSILPAEYSDGAHVISKRDVSIYNFRAFNLTGDYTDVDNDVDDFEYISDDFEDSHDEENSDDEENYETNEENYSVIQGYGRDLDYFADSVQYFVSRPSKGYKHMKKRRRKGLWLEMAVVADHTILDFYPFVQLRYYIFAMMNIVSMIINHESLGANMTLVITKLFLNKERDSIIHEENASGSLSALKRWNYLKLKHLSSGEEGWDVAVWLTRANLGGISGYSPYDGVCDKKRSAILCRDEGIGTAFVIAHELAHFLGITHDDDPKVGECPSDASKGSIMATTIVSTLNKYFWSSCSRRQFLKKSRKNWHCLHRRSNAEGIVLNGKHLKEFRMSLDDQCRAEFGDGYKFCKTPGIISTCALLYCSNGLEDSCTSKHQPPLEGTSCGKHDKVCISGRCQHIRKYKTTKTTSKLQLTGGGWSSWSEWSRCNASCGYGLIVRTRLCNNPPPRLHGSSCKGAHAQVQTCWSGKLCVSFKDPRKDICLSKYHTLMPYITDEASEWCNAWCVDYRGGSPIKLSHLPNGTPCSYTEQHNLCYEGACVRGECKASDSSCHRCARNECANIVNTYNTLILSRRGTEWDRIATIPKSAQNLSLLILSYYHVEIAVVERNSRIVKLRKHKRQLNDEANFVGVVYGKVVAGGTLIEWKQSYNETALKSKGILKNDLLVLGSKSLSSKPVKVSVVLKYTSPKGSK